MAQNTWNNSMTCFLGLEYLILTYDYFCLHKISNFGPKQAMSSRNFKQLGLCLSLSNRCKKRTV